MSGRMIGRAAPACENVPQQAMALSVGLWPHQPTELRAPTVGCPQSYHLPQSHADSQKKAFSITRGLRVMLSFGAKDTLDHRAHSSFMDKQTT